MLAFTRHRDESLALHAKWTVKSTAGFCSAERRNEIRAFLPEVGLDFLGINAVRSFDLLPRPTALDIFSA